MPDSFRPCVNCDYLLPAIADQAFCPECGRRNDFVAIDKEVQSAMAAPLRTILRGRLFSGDFLRRAWRARYCKPATSARPLRVALFAGLVLPMMALFASASIELKSIVQCTPHPVKQSTVIGQPTPCKPYHRPPFVETHSYSWRGWAVSNDQNGEWASLAFHPLGERVDRVVLGRSFVVSSAWSFPRSVFEDSIVIVFTLASWWAVAAVWLAFVNGGIRRASPIGATTETTRSNAKLFCALVLASSGIALILVIAADLVLRLTVPEFAVAGRGQWHSFRSHLPWAILIPVLLFWPISSKGPPGVACWVSWPTAVLGLASAFLLRLIARLKPPVAPRMRQPV